MRQSLTPDVSGLSSPYLRASLISAGCINALAHYYRLLGNLPGTPGAEKTRLRSEAVKMYERLQVIDSDRIERYRDMARLVQDSS